MMNELTIPEVRVFQEELFEYASQKNPDLLKLIREKRKLEPDIEKGITDLVKEYVEGIIGRRKKDKPDQFDDYVSADQKGEPAAAGKK